MTDFASIALGQLKSRLYNVRISVVINLPLRFWEMAIPKADRSPDTLIVSLISNHVISELTSLAVNGTPLGYLWRFANACTARQAVPYRRSRHFPVQAIANLSSRDDHIESPQLVSGGNDRAACLASPIFA